jgi:putative ABC transport system ATP-binding protein
MLLELENLRKIYKIGQTEVNALNGINLQVDQNDMIAVMGTSGCGKTTLLHMIGVMDEPTSGTIRFQGKDVNRFSEKEKASYRCKNIGFVFQDFKLIKELTLKENIMMPVLIAGKKIDMEYYDELMSVLEIADRQNHLPMEVSGGQKQRAAIARALINRPELLLADEPTGNLDQKNSEEIMQIFLKLHERGETIIMVTHDEGIAMHCQKQVKMLDGCIRSAI